MDRILPEVSPSYVPVPASQSVIDEPGNGPQLDYGKLLRKYALLGVALTVVGAIGGLLSAALITPQFKSRALLEVEPMNSGILKLRGSEEYTSGGEVDLLTEAQILRSNTFLTKAVQRLQPESVSQPPVQSDLLSKLRALLKSNAPDASAVSVDGEINPNRVAPALAVALRTLDVEPVHDTRLLELVCESTNPQYAADFLNALTDEYIQHNYEARMDNVQATARWISGQLEDTKTKMLDSERRLQEFVQNSGNKFLTSQDTLAATKLRDLQERLAVANAELIAKQPLYEKVQKTPPESLPNVLDDPTVKQYQALIADLRRQEADLTTTLTPQHPKVKAVEAQLSETQATLQKAIAAAVKRITNQYDSAVHDQELLKKSYDTLAQQLGGEAGKQAQFNALKKESDSAHDAYQTMLLQANQVSVAGSLPVNNIQPIDRAVPADKPDKPKPLMNIGMGAMGGLVCCLGIGFLREKADQRVSSPRHARQISNLPQLGVIPSAEEPVNRWRFLPGLSKGTLVEADSAAAPNGPLQTFVSSERPMLAESFRVTLASLMREQMGARLPQVILVTSPGPEEGKTTIASNLGVALAETGRRVLVVDGDFRRPRAHKVLGVPNTNGLVDLLTSDAPLEKYLREDLGMKTSVPNLFVLPNGTPSDNIAKALYSSRLRELLKRLRKEFDTILIDAPPMLHVADARVMSGMADGVVLVLRLGVTDKTSMAEALDQLRADRTVILGTVLNDWKPSRGFAKRSQYYQRLEPADRA